MIAGISGRNIFFKVTLGIDRILWLVAIYLFCGKEIQRVARAYPEAGIKALQQQGRGKGDAVREGFSAATGDLLFILDGDLTVAPEELPKFYEIMRKGTAEFANGVRLVYPMQQEAMRFLNMIANKLFGELLPRLGRG